jgi:2-polyprenyl-3-methyl-5-hydroxy-6-metoxy-1,4-benzoquinol methylase
MPISKSLFDVIKDYPYIARLLGEIVATWPAHTRVLEKSILSHQAFDIPVLERLSYSILQLTGDNLSNHIESYRWMCDIFNEEQVFFVRNKRYRYTIFEEANSSVYSNTQFMKKYMEGLLVSQLLWHNHAKAYIFHSHFINKFRSGFNYLEIGPGHGLHLSTVVNNEKCKYAEAWDYSIESLKQTNDSLKILETKKAVKLQKRDIQEFYEASSAPLFDVINISEVLEHLEQPMQALINLCSHLSKNGQILINFPINSPAPDHIYFLDSTESVVKLIESSGLKINSVENFPASGYKIERALKIRASVSVIVVASKC